MRKLVTSQYCSELDNFVRSTNYTAMQLALTVVSAAEAARWTWLAPVMSSEEKEEEDRKAEIVEMLLLLNGNGVDTSGIPSECEDVIIPCDGDLTDYISIP
jgi:hypothetical protein